MQKFTEESNRQLGHRRHPYRRQRRSPPSKQLTTSKQQLLQKYQKQLKDILQHSPAKRQSYVQPIQSHLFLDWQQGRRRSKRSQNASAQMRSLESKRISKQEEGYDDNQMAQHTSHRSQSLRKSDKLIMSRYDTLNEHGIAKVNRRYQLVEKLTHKLNNPPINKPVFLLPSIAERNSIPVSPPPASKDNNISKAEDEQVAVRSPPGLLKNGFYTSSNYHPSRKESPHLKNSNTIESPSHQTRSSQVKDYSSEYLNRINNNQLGPLNRTFTQSEFVRTQNSLNHFGKKTVFYRKLYGERAGSHQQLCSLARKTKKPIDLPDKDTLPTFINSYQTLDPTFDFKHVLLQANFGIVRFRDAVYIGECAAGAQGRQLRHGKGVYITKKCQFEGEFVNNQKKYGTEVTEEGIYKGHFNHGMRNGKGEFRWHNGEYYNGEWQNNKKHGSGIWTSSVLGGGNQVPDSYMGQWEAGNVHGYGVHTWNNGRSRYEGEFKGFLKHGRGVEKFENGDRYEGHYKDGKADGYGQYYWADGSYYKGSFAAGMREGVGVWMESTNDRYEGFLKEDCKHGKGILIYANGDIFEGTFEMDNRQGPGQLLIADRQQRIKGIWKNNQLQTT